MEVGTRRISKTQEFTWHQTGPFPIDMLYQAVQEGEENLTLYNASVLEIQRLLSECLNEGKRFRGIGSKWSLNDIAMTNGRIHSNAAMDILLPVAAVEVDESQGIKAKNLIFCQSGATINQITNFLEKNGQSLKVSGGSNGQTIAGAISTGVHGGAFERQCLSDYVRALHLVVGPNQQDRILLQPGKPFLKDSFAKNLNSRTVNDDQLFKAAIVGLGSMGFIAGVVMETEELFSLRRYIKKIEYQDAIKLMTHLDFQACKFEIASEMENGKRKVPYHFKVYVNQYNKYSVAEVMYKISHEQTVSPKFDVGKDMHPDLFSIIDWLFEKSNGKIIKLLTSLFKHEFLPKPEKPSASKTGTLGDMFHSVEFDYPGFSWALGVDNQHLQKAMNVFLSVFKKDKVPGLSAIKLVKQTDSLLGFTRFPTTAVIHLDGVQWDGHGKLESQEVVQEKIIRKFIDSNIEFTLHWGKNAHWNHPGLLDRMYGSRDDEWVHQRSRLLTLEQAELFSNDFIKKLGLGGYDRSAVRV